MFLRCHRERSKLDHLKTSPFKSTACDSSAELFNRAEKAWSPESLPGFSRKTTMGQSQSVSTNELYFWLFYYCCACLFTAMSKLPPINPRSGVMFCYTHARHLNLVGIKTHDSGSNRCRLLSNHSLFLTLHVRFWLGDIRHLGVDIEKCVWTSTPAIPAVTVRNTCARIYCTEPGN